MISRRTVLKASAASLAALALPQVAAAIPDTDIEIQERSEGLWITENGMNYIGFLAWNRVNYWDNIFGNTGIGILWFFDSNKRFDPHVCNLTISEPSDTISSRLALGIHPGSYFGRILKAPVLFFELENNIYELNYRSSYHCDGQASGGEPKFITSISYDLVKVTAAKRYRYRIKTKSGQIVGGTQQATDPEDAKTKIAKRYPEAQFLSLQED